MQFNGGCLIKGSGAREIIISPIGKLYPILYYLQSKFTEAEKEALL
jgi:hypothetical protein